LPYTLKFLAVEHFLTADTSFRGYDVPKKRTMIIPVLSEVHYDPKHFPNPKQFDPTRFLDDQGKFVAHPTMVAFGVGRRECLGKSLAKQETFLFSSCMLHQFAFDSSSAGAPDLGAATVGITRVPHPFKMRVRARQ
jgi:cytochrome P450